MDGLVGKLPFVAGLFVKTLMVVSILVVITWYVIVKFFGYEMIAADYGGSVISTVLFAYLVHLWMLPGAGPEDRP